MTPNLSRKNQSGSFMLEALISVVIFAMGLIALVGMAAQAINQVSQSKYRNDASYLASELVGEMWISAGTPAAFDTGAWEDRVAKGLPEGAATVTVTGTRVDILITWANKEDSTVKHQYVTSTQVARNT
jgi:type IV pilus assembly protein PilV